MFKRVKYRAITTFLGLALLSGTASKTFSQETTGVRFWSNDALSKRIGELAERNSRIVRAETVAKSQKENPIWLLEISSAEKDQRSRQPALLLVAGIEGNDLTGSSSAIKWAEDLIQGSATNENLQKLLGRTTIYIFPRLNPDAASAFFSTPKLERTVNTVPNDEDHDGQSDEDGPEDLNQDNLVTMMRVKDADGDHILDPSDSRLLLKADRTKGEVGAWKLYTEGKNNDRDEQWNEDGIGGVNLNRNFPYNYRFFSPGSGKHQVSEPETRALADFIVNHPNIAVVFTFGSADNLAQAPDVKDDPEGRKPPASIRKDDLPFFREVGKQWRNALGLKKELKHIAEPGTFSDWIYFHRGRLSLAAQPWSPALQLQLEKEQAEAAKGESKPEPADKEKTEAKADSKSETAAKPEKDQKPKGDTDNRNEEERAFLKWIEKNDPTRFVPWTKFQHPDFPGQEVEIGGYAPFAKSNPPEKLLEALCQKHSQFLTDLASKLPRIGVRKTKVQHMGNSVYEVTLQIENTGYLPTSLAQGRTSQEVHPTSVELALGKAELLSGNRMSWLDNLEGSGGMSELRFMIYAKGESEIGLQIRSVLGGSIESKIQLKEAN